jgi:hypothetical protein
VIEAWGQLYFTTGRAADLALAVIVIEAVALLYLGGAWRRAVPNLMAGACLLLALRWALTGAHWSWMAVALTASLIPHAFDMWLRTPDSRTN